ncbi:MAG: chemotaxis protein CheA [Candidatus Krumholzibacteriota bacterium]|nr:chemotaxis protein CheA [Candidatus Krumholzibacteriota bacterium]
MEVSDYKALFISEAEDILQALEDGIMSLEGNRNQQPCIEELFRHAHNLKGMSGAMGYDPVVEVCHCLESVLDRCRKGELEITAISADILLRTNDLLRELVQWQISEQEGPRGQELLDRVLELLLPLSELPATGEEGKAQDSTAPGSESAWPANFHSEVTSTRVDLSRLDFLMDLLGELIISRIRLGSLVSEIGSKNLMEELSSSSRLISEIQKEVMEIRLIPVGLVFQRFKRLVRDVSRELGKEVEFKIVGEDIGLDRTVLESMVDPLVHLIRNAIDHGIEKPSARIAAGKSSTGRIILSAKRERNHVALEIADDGRGIDFKKILAENDSGGASGGSPEELTEEEICRILTKPGFSTKEDVSRYSGRGIGMDIVKKTTDSLGGSLHIKSGSGRGTTITMLIPVNLSIIKALLFSINGGVHVLPIEYVQETLRFERGVFKTIRGREVIQTNDGPIPVIRVEEIFPSPPETGKSRFIKVIRVKTDEGTVALVVNRIIGQQDVVIKGLPSMIRGIGGISGATILGSGKIAFIWDPRVIFQGRSTYESDEKAVVLED